MESSQRITPEMAGSFQDTARFFGGNQRLRERPGRIDTGDWYTWPSLRLRVSNLPANTTTLEVYNNFKRYGNLVRINIFETRQGNKSSAAEIDYEPVPTTKFWGTTIICHNPLEYRVVAHLSNHQSRRVKIDSPVRKGMSYDERIEIKGRCLDFGVLSDPNSMMVMASCGDMQNQIRMILDLHKKEIEVHFPFTQASPRSTKVRSFRFHIALDEQFSFLRISDQQYVLHLSKPPWYYKMLSEAIASTHDKEARQWSLEDSWARQTDVHTQTIRNGELYSLPIALPKYLNDINIFRWTTFRFHALKRDRSGDVFFEALRDWNINVLDCSSFAVSMAPPGIESQVWQRINDSHHDTHSCEPQSSGRIDLDQATLRFSVRYQLEVCLSYGWLSEYTITPDFIRQLTKWPEHKARQALIYVATNQTRVYDPMTIFDDVQYSQPVRPKRLPDNCIEVHSATVTATGILFHTPTIEVTNRIIRRHKAESHRFLRVKFEDDNYRGQTRLYPSHGSKMVLVFRRVKRALLQGIKLGDIRYEFLAWGNSQIREHGAYFVASTATMTADQIRAEMGDFKEVVIAKKAARMGQCFSTTKPVQLQLKMVKEPDLIPDIKRGKYIFTDGVGKISPQAADLVSQQLKIKSVPSLFQFRLGGCKGVLAVSKDVPGVDVKIRKSQFKFDSLDGELEIIRWSEFWQPFLNRQIIICLSNLGVPSEVFLRKQNETIHALNEAMNDDGAATRVLRSNVDPNLMTLELCELVEAGFRGSGEPFVTACLHLWRAWSLKYLKEKAKIPVTQGAFVLGCVDETATLKGHTSTCPCGDSKRFLQDPNELKKLPEIFVQISDVHSGNRKIIEGLCILARNPSLHRGDIRVVKAVNVPALHHMCDVVVMPQTGDRDLPSMCSGGDLDGDDYIIIWDQDLLPRYWNAEPYHYDPPQPKEVVGEITTEDLIEFFHDYMRNDALGRIAHAHLNAADFLEDSIQSETCLKLLHLHSMAVDYPKTGVYAQMDRKLERNDWPHFMEKRGKPYHSNKVLGKLYDSVQKASFEPNYNLAFDDRVLDTYEPSPELFEKVQTLKRDYDHALRRILTQHDIKTEFELWSTFVLMHSKASRDYKFHEEVGSLSKVLKEQFYDAFCELAGGRGFDHLAPYAVASYKLTQYQVELAKRGAKERLEQNAEDKPEMPFISFPWVLQETLVKIAVQADDSKPRKTTAVVEESKVVDQATGLERGPDGSGEVELPDIADLMLTTKKLTQHLPDPILTNIVVPKQEEANKNYISNSTDDISPLSDSPPLDTPATDVATEDIAEHDELDNDDLGDKKQPKAYQMRCFELKYDQTTEPSDLVANKVPEEQNGQRIGAAVANRSSCDGRVVIAEGVARAEANLLPSSPPVTALMPAEARQPSGSPSPTRSLEQLQLQSPSRFRSHKPVTCFYWKMYGTCRYSEKQCRYAHHDTGVYARGKDQMTCWFWKKKGRCSNTAESCSYAHFDTGCCAPPPNYEVHGTSLDEALAPLARCRQPKTGKTASARRVIQGSEDDDDEEMQPMVSRTFRKPAQDHAIPLSPRIHYARSPERGRSRIGSLAPDQWQSLLPRKFKLAADAVVSRRLSAQVRNSPPPSPARVSPPPKTSNVDLLLDLFDDAPISPPPRPSVSANDNLVGLIDPSRSSPSTTITGAIPQPPFNEALDTSGQGANVTATSRATTFPTGDTALVRLRATEPAADTSNDLQHQRFETFNETIQSRPEFELKSDDEDYDDFGDIMQQVQMMRSNEAVATPSKEPEADLDDFEAIMGRAGSSDANGSVGVRKHGGKFASGDLMEGAGNRGGEVRGEQGSGAKVFADPINGGMEFEVDELSD